MREIMDLHSYDTQFVIPDGWTAVVEIGAHEQYPTAKYIVVADGARTIKMFDIRGAHVYSAKGGEGFRFVVMVVPGIKEIMVSPYVPLDHQRF